MKILRLYQTLKYLKPIQIRYRLWYMIKRKLIENGWQNKKFTKVKAVSTYPLELLKNGCHVSQNTFESMIKGQYVFINQKKIFEENIDWNRADLDEGTRLWKLNLHYQNYLVQAVEEWKESKNPDAIVYIQKIIKSWIDHNPLGKKDYAKDNWNSYSISLRIMNWVKVYSEIHSEFDEIFKRNWKNSLANQAQFLYENVEYDIQGNHLLENGFGLLFAAYFLQNELFYVKANKILKDQLEIQVLNDGAHFELSPMYHCIILERMLDSYNLVSNNTWKQDDLILVLTSKIQLMLSWLDIITDSGTSFPLLNDAANNIAPDPKQLFEYAKILKLEYSSVRLQDSGYRIFNFNEFRTIFDVGAIGPDFIPGHAHADSLQIVCNYKQKAFIVDTGISTYNAGKIRDTERSTLAHNTVDFQGKNSSKVWSSFRVAERAEVTIEKDEVGEVKAFHNGYKKNNVIHKRCVRATEKGLVIQDEIVTVTDSNIDFSARAHLHFHPEVTMELKNNTLVWSDGFISFENVEEIILESYFYAPEFNNRIPAQKAIIKFTKHLITNIQSHN